MIGRLGKQAAEVALQFLADGMSLDDAVRAGAKLMDEELSPAAEMMLKQNQRARDRFAYSTNPYAFIEYKRTPESIEDMSNEYHSPEVFRRIARTANRHVSEDARRLQTSTQLERPKEALRMRSNGSEVSAANGYAIRELLLDAAEGDMDVAYALARRLGFEGLL